jgi:hypothetical protein
MPVNQGLPGAEDLIKEDCACFSPLFIKFGSDLPGTDACIIPGHRRETTCLNHFLNRHSGLPDSNNAVKKMF